MKYTLLVFCNGKKPEVCLTDIALLTAEKDPTIAFALKSVEAKNKVEAEIKLKENLKELLNI